MKKRTPVSAIMTRDVITLTKNDTLEEAEHIFKAKNIRHIPIIDNGAIIGMLSYTDLLRISFADAVNEEENTVDTVVYNMFSIEQVMAKVVQSVNSTTTIKEVARILSKKEFHAIPVVDSGTLVGIVTTTDLINYLLNQF